MTEIEYAGNKRRGLTARCRREDGAEHVVAAADVVFPQGSRGARHVAAYRKWLGLDPYPLEILGAPRRTRQHKVTADDLDLSRPVELIALSDRDRMTDSPLHDAYSRWMTPRSPVGSGGPVSPVSLRGLGETAAAIPKVSPIVE